MNHTTQHPMASLDRELLQEFADALIDRAAQIEHDVSRLRRHPDDKEVSADLFRAFHNIKGDAALCKLSLVVAITHPIESLLSRCRDEELIFSDILAEIILLSLDRLELATDALLNQKPLLQLNLETLVLGLDHLATTQTDALDEAALGLIEEITGFRPANKSMGQGTPRGASPHATQKDTKDDLVFFRSLAQQLESRSPLFKGRTMRLLRLVLETNRINGNPVDPVQLEAAVYLHDIGMMFLPEHVWLKVGNMNGEEKKAMRNHPGFAAGMLQRIPGWEAAAEMVAQHHEMVDGGGYPNQLSGEAICAGAKILAIADAFEAVMLKHIHRGKNRSVLRAIAEINACNNQFAPEWIVPFNTVIRRTIES